MPRTAKSTTKTSSKSKATAKSRVTKPKSTARNVDTDGFGKSALSDEVVLEVKNLETHFTTRWGTVKAVDGVSYLSLIHI